ncbi:MAG: ribokinase [Nocardioidaceae bacterium]|nr:ribokinase [Nocardioidaceae bacterium]
MTTAPQAGRVVVVGSVNRDYVCRLARLPAPGATVLGSDVMVASGGKGGNQAVAAAHAGADVFLVACVGDDEDGRALLADLGATGVHTSQVKLLPEVRTGAAFVFVAPDGENSIVVAPGANGRVDPSAVTAAVAALLDDSGVLVVQAEIPVPAVVSAMQAASGHGGRAVLNLAPYCELPAHAIALADPLVVNETEAGELGGEPVRGVAGAQAAAVKLLERARSVVVTLGAQGAVVASAGEVAHVPAAEVEVIDSTGAGDAFTGALAAALSAGEDLISAVRSGVAAGTYAVGMPGAQPSYPKTNSDVSPPPSSSQE